MFQIPSCSGIAPVQKVRLYFLRGRRLRNSKKQIGSNIGELNSTLLIEIEETNEHSTHTYTQTHAHTYIYT